MIKNYYHKFKINSSKKIQLILSIICLFLLPLSTFAQIDVINKGLPIINNNLNVIIYGNVTHADDGNITNTGNFYVTGNWINTNPSDKIFTSGHNGWVHLDSADQTIDGSANHTTTHFNNLDLKGSGVKHVAGADIEVEDTLALHDRELEAADNTVLVMSTDTSVITRTTGFVSNTNDGGLARNTLFNAKYFFPVGSNAGTMRFRPVEVTPNDALANTFKVRMANVDPTSETFDRNTKDVAVGDINDKFYHRINRTNGASAADITVYYNKDSDLVGDKDYDIIAHWDDTPQWKNPGLAVSFVNNNLSLNGLTEKAFNDFNPTNTNPFALSHNVELSGDVYVPNVFSPNGDGKNDILFVRGRGIEEISFIIYDRWGEKVFETTDVNKGWDGTYKGQPMNLAVFVYVVKGKSKNGDKIDKKGNFTLLR